MFDSSTRQIWDEGSFLNCGEIEIEAASLHLYSRQVGTRRKPQSVGWNGKLDIPRQFNSQPLSGRVEMGTDRLRLA